MVYQGEPDARLTVTYKSTDIVIPIGGAGRSLAPILYSVGGLGVEVFICLSGALLFDTGAWIRYIRRSFEASAGEFSPCPTEAPPVGEKHRTLLDVERYADC